MKTTRTLVLFMAIIATIVIISCQKTDLAKADSKESATGKAPVSTVLESLPSPTILPDCNTHCIDPAGPFVESSGSTTKYWGNPANPEHWKTVSHVAYNTATTFVVNVTFTHSGGNASNTVSVTAFGTTKSVTTLASGATAPFTFDLPAGWKACDNVPFSIYQEGQNSPMNLSCSYRLYGICASKGCETSFTGKAFDCGTHRVAEYTFISKEALTGFKIQGGLTNFTGANATVYINGTVVDFNTISTDGWAQGTANGYTVGQRTPGGSSNRNIRVEGGSAECDELVIRIVWTSLNAGGVITGSWSVKDSNGTELAPAVAGLTCE